MKAVICTRYGSPDVLQLQDVAEPAPQEDEVLIRVRASSINARDWRVLRGNPAFIRLTPGGFLRPRNPILGADVAGRVEAVGRRVSQYKPGDDVFGYLPSSTGRGAYAEWVCASEGLVALKPAALSFEGAAAAPLAALTALQGLRDRGDLRAGHRVLIYGASGGVGTFAIQIARAYGADVTAACSARNAGLARSLGADQVLDYRVEDLARSGARYDLILAVNGYRPIAQYLRALAADGRLVIAGGSLLQLIQAALYGRRPSSDGGKRTHIVSLTPNPADLAVLRSLLESSRVVPVIDRTYPLSDVAEAFRHYERAHARGKIVITVGQPLC